MSKAWGKYGVLAVLTLVLLLGLLLAAGPASAVTPPPPNFWVRLAPSDGIFGRGWPAETSLTITADDPATATSPDLTFSIATDSEGLFFGEASLPSVRPGWFITVTDGATTKTHTVRDISITVVNLATDVVQGTADPYSEVWCNPDALSSDSGGLFVEADIDGRWSADFSGYIDVLPGGLITALQFDEDSDFTFVHYLVPLTLAELLGQMLADGRLPNAGVARAISSLSQKPSLVPLTNCLSGLVRGHVITQQTMDQILGMLTG